MMTVLQRYKKRMDRLEQWINTRNGVPLDITDESYVVAVHPEERPTPILMVETVAIHNGGLPTLTLTKTDKNSVYFDGESIDIAATGDLFDAEPGDTIELRLVKQKPLGES